jgi:hypothetical protein
VTEERGRRYRGDRNGGERWWWSRGGAGDGLASMVTSKIKL